MADSRALPAVGVLDGRPDSSLTPVHRHPACDDPRWAHLPTRFALIDATGSRWRTFATAVEAREEQQQRLVVAWSESTRGLFGSGCVIVQMPAAPQVRGFGGPRDALAGPWAGGTWSGRCGAMVWVADADGSLIQPYRVMTALASLSDTKTGAGWEIPQPVTCNSIAGASQTHHMLGNADAHGFFYECQHRFRHLGECGGVTLNGEPDGLGITWDPDLPLLTPRRAPTLF